MPAVRGRCLRLATEVAKSVIWIRSAGESGGREPEERNEEENMKTALISVSDKTGVVEFAKKLSDLGYRILSTGGTKKTMEEAGLEVIGVSEVTKFPEILDGRVKTLHPNIHGALLARRELPEHMKVLEENHIDTIDLVCVNLYPFEQVVANPNCSLEEAIENIDIGGPSMLRSAAKNYVSVIPVCDAEDYEEILEQLQKGDLDPAYRLRLAKKVYAHTAKYDTMISSHLAGICEAGAEGDSLPEVLELKLVKKAELRYGENPNQSAAVYVSPDRKGGIVAAQILNGKPMSYNNYADASAALACLKEFDRPAAVCLKHATPCGVCEADTIYDAYMGAYKADPVSVFGGIIALNRKVDARTAEEIKAIFCEIVIAPDFDADALELLKSKKNLRVLQTDLESIQAQAELKSISGGFLMQSPDEGVYESLDCVTKEKPSEEELRDLVFAMKVAKHAKSNAIVTARAGATIGIGTGQVSRVWATKNAINNTFSSVEGAVLASDAFFPFPDSIDLAHEAGIRAIIQPGGSIRDEDVIKRADELGIKMLISKARHFRH